MTFQDVLNGHPRPFRKRSVFICPNCGRQIMNYLVKQKDGHLIFVCPKCGDEISPNDLSDELSEI